MSREVREALNQFEIQCRQSQIQIPPIPRFPIRIALSAFAAALSRQDADRINSLLDYIVRRVSKRVSTSLSVQDLRRWMNVYPWIIILDGLDEVPASGNRADVLNSINDFWIDATSLNADLLVIATTRPQGYNQDYAPNLYRHKWLAPLSNERALHYGSCLATIRYGHDTERRDRVITRLERASRHEATARLMRSPLQVTIMTTLVDRIGQPPEERWSLFKEYYNVIYQREVERDIPASTVLREYKPDIDAIHNNVGLLLQVKGDYKDGTEARLSTYSFAEIVESRLKAEGNDGQILFALKQRIIEAAAQRLVFLVGLEEDRVGFEIRSLQEFMAAEGLMNGSDAVVMIRLREIAPLVNWRNVFLFTAGRCFAERQHLRDTIYSICAALNENGSNKVGQAIFAGSELAIDLLDDGPSRRQPRYAHLLCRLALRILDQPCTDQHVRLARLFEPTLESIYKDEIETRMQHTDPAPRCGAWCCLIELAAAGVNFAKELIDSRWPDESQKPLICRAVSGSENGFVFMISKSADIIPEMEPQQYVTNIRHSLIEPSLRRFSSSALEKNLKFQIPDWLVAFLRNFELSYRLHSRTNATTRSGLVPIPICLTSSAVKNFTTPFRLVGSSVTNDYIPLKNMPRPQGCWTPLVANANFLEAPSKNTLAQQLRYIFNEPGSNWTAFEIGGLSWPLGCCLANSSGKGDLLKMAELAERGKLGDYGDWMNAENRWINQGIKTDDIIYMTDEHLPFNDQIDRIGFPISVVQEYIEPDVERAEASLDRLIALHAQHKHSIIGKTLATWVFDILRSLKFRYPSSKKFRYSKHIDHDEILALIEDASGGAIYIDVLFDIFVGRASKQELIEIFDAVGRARRIYTVRFFPKENSFSILTEGFSQNPMLSGLLRVLAMGVREGAEEAIPKIAIRPELYSSPTDQAAAIELIVAKDDAQGLEVGELSNAIMELSKKEPAILNGVVDIFWENNAVSPFMESLIINLYHRFSRQSGNLATYSYRALKNKMNRRTSKFLEPRFRFEYEFPDGLLDIIKD
jgi:hypothetical protein